ncbi:RidA family protein [Paenibacillus sp. 598K]|uniref:RidA family protein n=1 Tax=Paenibacillus sp. 598K TaxID=1117987 RepID=UPI0016265220|nr:RidA family protein [Paenibacillus sp. 598K]
MSKVTRSNPAGVSPPVGKYSHLTRIPRGAALYVSSGQVGTAPDGSLPAALSEQIAHTFRNIAALLQSERLEAGDIVKVNIWATEELDWTYLYEQWDALFGGSYPSMTVGYVSALGLPELKIEIELWMARVEHGEDG